VVVPVQNSKPSSKSSRSPSEHADHDDEKQKLIVKESGDDDSEEEGSDGSRSDSDTDSEALDKELAVQEENDDAEWEKCQSKLAKNKERALEGKSKSSHPVHCPYFPDVKQEYWWTYVCDKKSKQLVTAPYFVTDLVDREDCQLQFTAPRKIGHHTYTVCLRSDSFLGFDQSRDIKLDVQEAKEIDEHPQWDISDEEEEKEAESNESEYATDEDVDDDDED